MKGRFSPADKILLEGRFLPAHLELTEGTILASRYKILLKWQSPKRSKIEMNRATLLNTSAKRFTIFGLSHLRQILNYDNNAFIQTQFIIHVSQLLSIYS